MTGNGPKTALATGRPVGIARIAGAAAFLAAAVLIAGIVGLVVGWSAGQPWLAVLFGIDAGMGGLSMESLHVIAPIDVALLVLSGLVFAGFWPGTGKPRKLWMALAVVLPFAGIAVLAATGLAGRSGLMGGLLVLSCLMLSNPATRALGCGGLAASTLLLIGDFTTTGPPSALAAGVVAGGYVLLVAWFVAVGAELLGLQLRTHTGTTDTVSARPGCSRSRG